MSTTPEPTPRQQTNAGRAAYIAGLVDTGKATELREVAGHSCEEAGRRLRVAASTVHRWEHGLRRPLGRNVAAYARYLARIEDGAAAREPGQAAPE
jgi:DNA-binding transcriptional regulator YiaG